MGDEKKPNGKKRNTQPGRPGYLEDPRKAREGEVVGGGWFVFRRGRRTGRIRAPEYPFEHPTFEAALAERDRLRERFSDERFDVLAVLDLGKLKDVS